MMTRHSGLVTIWVIAWLCLTVMVADSVKTRNCLQLIPRDFWNQTVYNDSSQQLFVDFDPSSNARLVKCLNLTKSGTDYRLQLVSVGQEEEDRGCCDLECASASVYQVRDVKELVMGRESGVTFDYVQGRYFLRLVRVVSEGGGTCEEGSFSSCSSMCGRMEAWGKAGGECGNTSSSDVEVIINQSYQDSEQVCSFELDISLALCHAIHPYSRVNVSNVEVPLNFSCSSMDLLDWDNFEVTSP